MEQDYRNLVDGKLQDSLTAAEAENIRAESTLFDSEEVLYTWLTDQDCLQKKKRRRMLGGGLAAAVFVCLILALSGIFNPHAILPESLSSLLGADESIASPNPDGSITEENGSIVIGGDGNGNVGTWTATFTSYDDIPEKYQSQIIWFEEMPEGYELEGIEIVRNQTTEDITSIFYLENTYIRIKQTIVEDNENAVFILNQFDAQGEFENADMYVKEIDDYAFAFVLNNSMVRINISEGLERNKIEAMLASAKIGLSKT